MAARPSELSAFRQGPFGVSASHLDEQYGVVSALLVETFVIAFTDYFVILRQFYRLIPHHPRQGFEGPTRKGGKSKSLEVH